MRKFNLLTMVMVMMFVISGTSCTHLYYQVYNTKAVDDKQLTNAENYAYETTDYTIRYALWEKNGNPGFEIINKSDEYIYIDLTRSFFVRNGYAYDYAEAKNVLYQEATTSNKFMTIPPHTQKVFTRFEINKQIFMDCDLEIKPRKSESVAYTQETTPLTFGNIISVQVGKNDPEILTHKFYVSRITNYNSTQFFTLHGTRLPNPNGGVDQIRVDNFEKACKGSAKATTNGGAVSVPSSCFYTSYIL